MIKYKIKNLSKFKNLLVKKGKLAFANSLMMNILFFIKRKSKKNPINLANTALEIITPGINTKKHVVAGKLYNLPTPITKSKSLYFSCHWLQLAAIENKEYKHNNLDFKISEEFQKVLLRKGQSFVFLKQHNKMVSENRPFLRFVRRKFKPRLPRKVWLKKKRILWLSRKKKFKPQSHKSYGYSFGLFGAKKYYNPDRKFMLTSKLLSSRHFRVYNGVNQYRAELSSKLKQKKNNIIKLKKIIKQKKKVLDKKLTNYSLRSLRYANNKKYENKTIINKNKFYSRS